MTTARILAALAFSGLVAITGCAVDSAEDEDTATAAPQALSSTRCKSVAEAAARGAMDEERDDDAKRTGIWVNDEDDWAEFREGLADAKDTFTAKCEDKAKILGVNIAAPFQFAQYCRNVCAQLGDGDTIPLSSQRRAWVRFHDECADRCADSNR